MIMKYEYMKEYSCNGEEPNLPNGTLIELYCRLDDEWYPSKVKVRGSIPSWREWDKFRIVDERYKPKSEDVYTNTCGIRACKDREDWERCGTDVSDFELSVTQTGNEIIDVSVVKDTRKSDWFERGDLPPVGEVVDYWYCRGKEYKGNCIIRGYNGHEVWCKTIDGENHFNKKNFVVTNDCEFTPIKPTNLEPKLVGSTVECLVTGDRWVKCKVLSADEDALWLKTVNSNERLVTRLEYIRPIQSEQNKFTNNLAEHIKDVGNSVSFAVEGHEFMAKEVIKFFEENGWEKLYEN